MSRYETTDKIIGGLNFKNLNISGCPDERPVQARGEEDGGEGRQEEGGGGVLPWGQTSLSSLQDIRRVPKAAGGAGVKGGVAGEEEEGGLGGQPPVPFKRWL